MRKIRLTRIHAIQWYGYNDTLDVTGNLLLAGVTGSGKSVIMDLIQLVLAGTERALFNRSATGTTSERTLKGYCLLDTKRGDFVRDKGAITYVALEFTWPDGQRAETWGLRIEFRSAAESHGRVAAFVCDGRMEKADFLDGERRPLELPAFRALVKDRDGRVFETQEQYLREMAYRLNFNREVLSTLLPTAMSFTNLKSFDEFCRRYILPGGKIAVEDVVASYRSFRAYEEDLRELREQLLQLREIHDRWQRRENAARDFRVARYLGAEFQFASVQEMRSTREVELAELRAAFSKDEARIAQLDADIAQRKDAIKDRELALGELPGGDLYRILRNQIRKLNREVSDLREIGTRLDDALRRRVKNSQQWLRDVQSAPVPERVPTAELEHSIRRLEACAAADTERALNDVRAAAEQTKSMLLRAVRPVGDELRGIRDELGKLREQIPALERGQLPFPTRLLNALNEALPKQGRELAAQPLCHLIEVVDENWREAIEVVFTRKFAIVVNVESDADFKTALRIYHELREEGRREEQDARRESLIDPRKAMKSTKTVRHGSLAEKLSTQHPVARAVVAQLFGDLICVETRDELRDHDYAILSDGFMTRGAFVERPRRYDGMPFVGRRGLEQQLAMKRNRLGELEARDRQLAPREAEVRRVADSVAQLVPEGASLIADLTRAKDLPKKESEMAEAIAQLNQMDRATFEEREKELSHLSEELGLWEKELRGLLQNQTHLRVEQAIKVYDAAVIDEEAQKESFRAVREEFDISQHLARVDEVRTELAAFPANDVKAKRCGTLERESDKDAEKYWEQLKSERQVLALNPRWGRKFEDLVVDNQSNADYDQRLELIEHGRIEEYTKKSEDERRRWEGLFRTQVLQKMEQGLKKVRDDIFLLNQHLRQPIGSDTYEVDPKPSPEFRALRQLVEFNTQHREDELFFHAVDGELRAALEAFLRTLVDQPDSIEAARLLDYRNYYDYKLLVRTPGNPAPIDVDEQAKKMSGGENQSPYFIAILASYLRAYNRHEARWRDPSLALVPIDEAFSKMDGERIRDCIEAIGKLDLQGVFSMSTGNISYAFSLCSRLIIVSKHEEQRGGRTRIRNVTVSIDRDSPEGRDWMERHA
ncbi:MAG: SbcC/MukB-like Walker B domain-containing protein [Terrimicrobiaceae bacterium]